MTLFLGILAACGVVMVIHLAVALEHAEWERDEARRNAPWGQARVMFAWGAEVVPARRVSPGVYEVQRAPADGPPRLYVEINIDGDVMVADIAVPWHRYTLRTGDTVTVHLQGLLDAR